MPLRTIASMALSMTSSRRATSQSSHRSPQAGHSCIGTSRTTATLPSRSASLARWTGAGPLGHDSVACPPSDGRRRSGDVGTAVCRGRGAALDRRIRGPGGSGRACGGRNAVTEPGLLSGLGASLSRLDKKALHRDWLG
jgi:hypothetical protein